MPSSSGLFAPVVVSRRNGLELNGHDLAGGDEAGRVRCVVRTASLKNIEIRLDIVNQVPSHSDRKCAPFFGSGG